MFPHLRRVLSQCGLAGAPASFASQSAESNRHKHQASTKASTRKGSRRHVCTNWQSNNALPRRPPRPQTRASGQGPTKKASGEVFLSYLEPSSSNLGKHTNKMIEIYWNCRFSVFACIFFCLGAIHWQPLVHGTESKACVPRVHIKGSWHGQYVHVHPNNSS